MFRFKQFNVDQTGCAMKINTDGVLLGAMIDANKPGTILDIGTGTGVIALMLAQKFTNAQIDAVEIDEEAAKTAKGNFKGSPFAERLSVYALSFEKYFDQFLERKYDLIVSNPPFYIASLKSPGVKKTLAKHTDIDFFEKLIKSASEHLTRDGSFWLILPANIAGTFIELTAGHLTYPQRIINIQSYPHSQPHRVILCFGFDKVSAQNANFTIYKAVGIYSEEYQKLLQPYFIAF
ncbi:MAG: yfiC [Mucilaginibacter sp.]|nr:yfiC [Mucilaginibacter sp.]